MLPFLTVYSTSITECTHSLERNNHLACVEPPQYVLLLPEIGFTMLVGSIHIDRRPSLAGNCLGTLTNHIPLPMYDLLHRKAWHNFYFYFAGMRNLCVSCSLVCLILLAASIFVFWVGIFKKQVPPVFVVSVLYILAGKCP